MADSGASTVPRHSKHRDATGLAFAGEFGENVN